MQNLFRILFVFTILTFLGSAHAQDFSNKLQIHGFGGWGYGKTDGYHYLLGSKDGNYQHSQFALALSANPIDNITIFAQLFWGSLDEGQQNADYDFAFVEWGFSDAMKFRIGKVKHPFGIYTEVYDVGTIRPFFSLPQGIYSPQGLVAKSYNGLGFTGSRYSELGWGLQYEVYAGKLDLDVQNPWTSLEEEAGGEEGEEEEDHGSETGLDAVKDVLGGRLIFATPIDGLHFGGSAYFGTPQGGGHGSEEGEPASKPKHQAYGLQVEYLSDRWSMRSEFGRHKEGDELTINGAYLEVAYHLTEQWQLATRYDWSNAKVGEIDLSEAPSLVEHKDIALGLNYWVSSNFVLKAAYHIVDGNRFALPEELHEAIEHGELGNKTHLFQFGTHFSF